MLHTTDGIRTLSERVEFIDRKSNYFTIANGCIVDILHFIAIIERITNSGSSNKGIQEITCLSPVDADTLLEGCRLIARLTESVPEIVVGPCQPHSQYWVGTGKPSQVMLAAPILREADFIPVTSAVNFTTKPFPGGLFTSTGILNTHGMWRMYLDLKRGSTLHPLPWHVWSIDSYRNLTIHEITSASEWVDFVLCYPKRRDDLLYPDWRAASEKYDAVHMTLRAICATQGLYFLTTEGIVSAPYWDVETTLWLRWCFNSAQFVEKVS